MDRVTEYGVVLTESDAWSSQTRKGEPTVTVTGKYLLGGGSQTNTLHLGYQAAVELHRKLSEIL